MHMRLYPYNVKNDRGIEIPELWMPTIKKTTTRELCNYGTMEEHLFEMHQEYHPSKAEYNLSQDDANPVHSIA